MTYFTADAKRHANASVLYNTTVVKNSEDEPTLFSVHITHVGGKQLDKPIIKRINL